MLPRLAQIVLALVLAAGGPGAHAAQPPASSDAALPRDRFGAAISAIQTDLQNREFEKVERLHDQLVASRARTSDGTWMIESFEWAFDSTFSANSPGHLEQLFEDWRRMAPASSLRPLAEAFMWQNRAWRARGSGCSPAWIAGAKQIYDLHLQRASRALEAAAGSRDSPLWYTEAIRIAGGQARAASELEALLEEGERRHPAYRPLYWARLMFLLPAWGGDYEQVDQSVRRAVERTRATEGASFYAGLYVDLARYIPCGDVLAEADVSWPDMKQGFVDWIERHDAVWNWNLFGTFACRVHDRQATARILGHLGQDAHLGTWSSGVSTESCRAMLLPEPPATRISLAGGGAGLASSSRPGLP